MRLAFANLLHDRTRFAVTVAGIAFSTFLMIFQGSLLAGFLHASSRVIESVHADLWIASHGANSFDFATPLPANYKWMARSAEGVASVSQIVTGLGFWQRPDGTRQTISVVGADRDVGGDYPITPAMVLRNEAALIDASDQRNLAVGIQAPGVEAASFEISGHRVRVERTVNDFSTFLGTPYVFMGLSDARRCLNVSNDAAMFLAIRVAAGHDAASTQAALQRQIPEADVWTGDEFAFRAKRYWTLQTGAGGALLTAAALGFVVGVLIVSQTVYATTMENLEEFATLKALGASSLYIMRIVVAQALAAVLLGFALGMLAAFPIMSLARQMISWVYTPWQLAVVLGGATLALAALASITAVRAAVAIEPGRVFRA
jgi:putative ABC transport system permease protein